MITFSKPDLESMRDMTVWQRLNTALLLLLLLVLAGVGLALWVAEARSTRQAQPGTLQSAKV